MKAPDYVNPYHRECKRARRMTNRRDRHQAREHMAHGRFDAVRMSGQTKTQGWITW